MTASPTPTRYCVPEELALSWLCIDLPASPQRRQSRTPDGPMWQKGRGYHTCPPPSSLWCFASETPSHRGPPPPPHGELCGRGPALCCRCPIQDETIHTTTWRLIDNSPLVWINLLYLCHWGPLLEFEHSIIL